MHYGNPLHSPICRSWFLPAAVASTIACLATTDRLSAQTWRRASPTVSPTVLWDGAAAYDPARRMTVVYGGLINGSTPSGATWLYDGTTWKRGAGGPPVLQAPCMSYDPIARRVLLFGGATKNSSGWALVNQTWAWDGQKWSKLTTRGAPSIRFRAAMTYDSRRRKTVLFGGQFFRTALADTWEFDSRTLTWTRSTASTPGARHSPAMSYDTHRGVSVMLGSPGAGTWEYNGSWRQVATTTTPSGYGYNAEMVYDTANRRMVLHGGGTSVGGGLRSNASWEFDGHHWKRVSVGGPALLAHYLAYDSVRKVTVCFGGFPGNNLTWEYAGGTTAYWARVGQPCSGRVTIAPTLLPKPASAKPEVGKTFTVQATQLPKPNQPLPPVGLFGLTKTSLSLSPIMPGCSLYTTPAFLQVLANNNGQADWTLPIPGGTTFIGVTFYQQVFVPMRGANTFGALMSNGGEARIGR